MSDKIYSGTLPDPRLMNTQNIMDMVDRNNNVDVRLRNQLAGIVHELHMKHFAALNSGQQFVIGRTSEELILQLDHMTSCMIARPPNLTRRQRIIKTAKRWFNEFVKTSAFLVVVFIFAIAGTYVLDSVASLL